MSAVAEMLETAVHREADFFQMIENSPVALAIVQRPGRLNAFNCAFERLFNVAPSRKPTFLTDLIPVQNRKEAEELLSELFYGSRKRFQFETQTGESQNRLLRWIAWPAHSGQKDVEWALLTVEDRSDAALVEQRLRQAEKLEMVGRLAGGVAHDFNNVMTGVLLYCDLLISVLDREHRARSYAEEIRQAGIQATGLARQLLSVARQSKPLPHPISLNEISEGMRSLLTRMIGENIHLKLHLDPDLGLVKLDPAQAQQILLNLVLNARDALPEGGHITVETGNCHVQVLSDVDGLNIPNPTLPCALFTVADDGTGMDEFVRAHLFEPFFTTKTGKGTGIGLSTVHEIVTTNGGLIHVDSKPGCGARISVLLPLLPGSVPESFQKKNFYPVSHRDLLSFQSKDSTL